MEQIIGKCPLCGGDVVGFVGAWHSILPPPAPQCSNCGAVRKSDVIEMERVIPMVPKGG